MKSPFRALVCSARAWTELSGWPRAWVPLLTLTGLACSEPSYGMAPDAETAVAAPADARVSAAANSEAGSSRRDTGEGGLVSSPTDVGAVDAGASGPLVDDAAVTDTPGQEAGAADWWTPLAAHENYAVRVRFFSRDRALGNAAAFAHEILFWAKLRVDAASSSVAMELRRCVDQGVITTSVTTRDDFSWTYAARLPPEQHSLVMRDGKIRSEADARAIGYVPAQPDECKPGVRLPARPDQAWLKGGTCECRSELLPVVAADCRVTDVDGDGQAGVTIRHVGFPAMVEAARAKDSCQIVDGVLQADGRMSGFYIENYDVVDLSCGNNTCAKTDIIPCPRELNPVLFEPLSDVSPSGEPWDCSKVEAEAARLLPSQMLSFPTTGC